MPMSGVRIGGEAKLLYNGVASIGDGRLASALVYRRVDRDDVGGSVVGVVCRAQGSGRFRTFRQLAPRGIEDGIIGRMVLGHVCAFRSKMSIR